MRIVILRKEKCGGGVELLHVFFRVGHHLSVGRLS